MLAAACVGFGGSCEECAGEIEPIPAANMPAASVTPKFFMVLVVFFANL
jgi:hypothetical protein